MSGVCWTAGHCSAAFSHHEGNNVPRFAMYVTFKNNNQLSIQLSLNDIHSHPLACTHEASPPPCCSGGFPVVLDNLWLGAEESEAIATTLKPKLDKTLIAVRKILVDVCVLEVALRSPNIEAVNLANLMPASWAHFIRNSDVSEVRPM